MTRGVLVVLVALAGCGLLDRGKSKPKRVATPKPLRVGPAAKAGDLAADPTPAPTTAQILAEGGLAGISDGTGALIADDGAVSGEIVWLAATLDRGTNDEQGRTLIRIRRAAFGVHVPRVGDRREIAQDVLEDRGLGIDASAVALVGEGGVCLAQRGKPIVTALDVGGHRLDIRWPLLGCPPGPWAPIGFVAYRVSPTLRWVPPQCDEPDDVRAAWQDANADPLVRLGGLRDGETIVALVGQQADGNWLWFATPDGWRARGFALAGKPAIGCSTTPEPDAVPEGQVEHDTDG